MDENNLIDFVEQRNKWRRYSDWPLHISYGLYKFEAFQALDNFTAHTVSLVLNFIPGLNTYPSSRVFDSARLSRFKNFRDNIV